MSARDMRRRRRIAFVLPNLSGGGAERVMVTLLRHLDRHRFEPHLVLVEAAGPYLGDVPGDVRIHQLGTRRVRHAIPLLVLALWRLRPHVVVSTQGYMNFTLLLIRPLLRSKLVVREVIGDRYMAHSRYRDLLHRWYLHLVRRADRIITQSDAAADDMRVRVQPRPGQLVRLHNPVDAAGVTRRARAAACPYEGDEMQVVAAGRLDPQKGFDLLLEAFAGVLAAGVPARLTILGEGPERAALVARAARLDIDGAVRFAGFQHNPYPYFAHADLFVLSSRFEGLPNVVLEALACGCPVVAFDCPAGVREVVRDGMNGLLVPPEDVGGLRDAMVRLLASPEELARLRTRIPATLAPFTATEIVRHWEALFDDLAA